jgi:ParB family chromosome partitioning protein
MVSSNTEQKTELVEINRITISGQGRSLNSEWVEELARSIDVLGMLQPAVVTPDFRLVVGRHRVEACKSLNWTHVPVVVRDYSDIEARLATIDENLVRNNLTALEEGEQLAERQSIYQVLHPETRRGVAGARARHGSANEVLSFAEDTAAKTGQSVRNVQRKMSIVDRLPQEVRDAIRDTPLADSYADMQRLRDYNCDMQEDIIDAVRAGKAESVAEAVNVIHKARQLPRNADVDKLEKAKGALKKASSQLNGLGEAILDSLTPEMKRDIRDSIESLRSACDAILSVVDLDLFAAGYTDLKEAA